MPRYLLSCNCGQAVPVELGQAGGQVVCRCGRPLDVPPLRRLRELPLDEFDSASPRRDWRPRYGVVAALLIAAAVPASASLWLHLNEPRPPAFDTAAMQKRLAAQLDEVTPAAAWKWWIDNHAQLENGFQVYSYRLPEKEQQQLQRSQFVKLLLLVPAGIALAAAACVAVWPSSRAARSSQSSA